MPKRWNLRLISLLTLTRSGPLTMMCTEATIFDSDSDQTWRSVHSKRSEQPYDANRSWQARTVHIEYARDGGNARSQTVERNGRRHTLQEHKGSRLDCRGARLNERAVSTVRERAGAYRVAVRSKKLRAVAKGVSNHPFRAHRASEQHVLIIVMTSETAGSKYIFHQ